MITTQDKLRCAQRELALRQIVYHKRLEQGLMSRQQVEHELACMAAIVVDYAAQLRAEPQLPLFATPEAAGGDHAAG
jgi:hypothetical protein